MRRGPKTYLTAGVSCVGPETSGLCAVRMKIDGLRYYMSTAEAYDLANRLVDAAERIEREGGTC